MAPSFGWSEKEAIGNITWLAIGLGVFFIPIMLRVVPDRGVKDSVTPRLKIKAFIANLKTIFYNKPVPWFPRELENQAR